MLESFIYEHSNVKFEFFVLTSSNVGKKFVEDYGYKFSCIDLYNEDYNITRYNCFNWSSKEEFELFIEIQKQIIDKYNLEFEHTLNLPILFEHSSPKPSHPIYWNEGELKQWKALRRR